MPMDQYQFAMAVSILMETSLVIYGHHSKCLVVSDQPINQPTWGYWGLNGVLTGLSLPCLSNFLNIIINMHQPSLAIIKQRIDQFDFH